MSIKDVKNYHLRMTSDYLELKRTLEKLESEITPESTQTALQNIERIKQQVAKLQENYNRINYIIYLLNMPTRKNKQPRWENQNKKTLNNIPEKDREKAIHKENKKILNELNGYINC